MAKTLIEMAGLEIEPGRLSESCLVLIDMQGEYERGLALQDIHPATEQGAILLERARAMGTPVIHVLHEGQKGSLFDPEGPGGAILEAVTPKPGEIIITKKFPNSFRDTNLHEVLQETGRNQVIFIGFMTHMCVSTTVRRALDFGYYSTVVGSACAARDLPDGKGGIIPAADLHNAALAALSDMFAVIAPDVDAILD